MTGEQTKTAAPWPSISVIVPVRIVDEEFLACLQSLYALDPAPQEVLLVLDGSPDEVPKEEGRDLELRVIRLPVSRGPARARNQGAAQARGDVLFFLDADVEVGRDAVKIVRCVFQEDNPPDALFGCYDDIPQKPDVPSQYRNLLHHYTHLKGNEDASTFWAGCGACRRDVFLDLGGFDDRFDRPSIEDIELGYRLKRAGRRIRLVKNLRCTHLKQWGFFQMLGTDLFDRAVPWTRLILRDRRFINDLNLRTSNRVSIAAMGALTVTGIAAPWAPALAWGSAIALLALMASNASLLRFFVRKRGGLFAIRTVPLLGMYYLCCGLGFFIGIFQHVACPGRPFLSHPDREPLQRDAP